MNGKNAHSIFFVSDVNVIRNSKNRTSMAEKNVSDRIRFHRALNIL